LMHNTNQEGVLGTRAAFKPFEYERFFEYFKLQQQAHWLPTEVPMADDVTDYKVKLTSAEKNLIIQVLRFFTQGDIEVGNNYNNKLLTWFHKPEIVMMLTAFAGIENIHVWAYSHLNDTLGLPDSEYSAFLTYEAMKSKYDFLQGFKVTSKRELAKNLAVFGAFMEGVSLFSSFAILMNFPRRGLLKNVGQIITWSIRDESLHSEGISELFNTMVDEDPSLMDDEMQRELLDICGKMIELEDNFIDTCFAMGDVEGLKAIDVKSYIRFIANQRLARIGLPHLFSVEKNPLEWLTVMVNAKEHMNFFEGRATEYAKGVILDTWDD
jgi:ribonucleoside-diphosphate reductase beta chain